MEKETLQPAPSSLKTTPVHRVTQEREEEEEEEEEEAAARKRRQRPIIPLHVAAQRLLQNATHNSLLLHQNPEPADPWSGVRNGSLPIPKCPQLSSRVPGAIEGQEDCLYLNVYTPKPSPSNLPVMVYIHGGGFAISSAGEGGSPAPLMQKDIVLVTMNYRLGTLGFLSTNDNILPGNLGLKDQVLALQWVQDNIELFGGNPKQVTIFGVSAGGISVHFHILSPSSKGEVVTGL
ncbi:Esterase FE4 [Portunus trituberculatus]|uniref:Carboxylic ester hydrolase n=1 Tax=Portunus trituberculatus TaxID=210409 RepID=A0A5B7D7N9_PORTR|nr:Esterase FE4 [Portunus trituberculatus]